MCIYRTEYQVNNKKQIYKKENRYLPKVVFGWI